MAAESTQSEPDSASKSIEKMNAFGDSFVVTREGARVQVLRMNNRDILRKDEGPNAKRSGIPILGPTPGPNEGIWKDVAPGMPQHGTDRTEMWDIVEGSETPTSVTLRRRYNGEGHPLKGEARITIAVNAEHAFTLQRETTNQGDAEVPFGTGLHSYFSPEATFRDIENPQGGFNSIFPLENGKSYAEAGSSRILMTLGKDTYLIEATPKPLVTMVWAENRDDHQCVEPWWAAPGEAPMIKPGETRKETYSIRMINPQELEALTALL